MDDFGGVSIKIIIQKHFCHKFASFTFLLLKKQCS